MHRILKLILVFASITTSISAWADIQVQGYLNNAAVENVTSDPGCIPASTCPEGRIIWDSVLNLFRIYDGATWNSVATGGTVPDPLQLSDNANTAPTYSFSSETNAGLFRNASGHPTIANGGVDILTVGDDEVTSSQPIVGIVGSTGEPSYSFTGAIQTGMFRSGSSSIGFSVANSNKMILGTTANVSEQSLWLQDGTAGAPSLAFESDPDTGLFSDSTDDIKFSAGGDRALFLTDGSMQLYDNNGGFSVLYVGGDTGQDGYFFLGEEGGGFADDLGIQWDESAGYATFDINGNEVLRLGPTYAYTDQDLILRGIGSASDPQISFSGDNDTGFFRSTNHVLSVTAAGVNMFSFRSTYVTSAVSIRGAGNAGAPAFSFTADSNTGFYQAQAGQLDVSVDAIKVALFADSSYNFGLINDASATNVEMRGVGEGNMNIVSDSRYIYISTDWDNDTSSGGGVIMNDDAGNGPTIATFTTTGSAFRVAIGTGATLCYVSAGSYKTTRTCTSSKRYKEKIETLPDVASEKLYDLRPVSFDWKDEYVGEHKRDYGFIAEEVEEILPKMVFHIEDPDDPKKMLTEGVRYKMLTPLIIAEMKKLKATNDELLNRVAALEAN